MSDAGRHPTVAGVVERAAALTDLRRWPEAITLLGRALADDPSSGTVWCEMARARLGAGDAQGALDAAGRAAVLRPDSDWPYRLASLALEQLGRRVEAVEAARTAIRCEPFAWQTHVRLASVATGRRQRVERSAAVAQALTLAPLEPTVHLAAGEVALDRGRRQEASSHFARALELDPQSSVAHHELARASTPRWRSMVWMVTPSEYAAAATGFARALGADPRQAISRDGVEMVTRLVLRRACVVLGVAGLVTAFVMGSAPSSMVARLVPALGLAAAGYGIVSYLRRVPAGVRRHLVTMVGRRHLGASALLVLGACGLALSVVLPGEPASIAARAAYTSGMAASVILLLGGRRRRRAGPGR